MGVVGPSTVAAVLCRCDASIGLRLVGVTAVVSTTTMVREWYSPIHAQFWLTCALILTVGAPPRTRWHRAADVALAVAAGLAGAVSLVAAPVLVAASVVDRERRRHWWRVAAVLATVGGINIVVGASREVSMPVGRLAWFTLVKTVWQPLTGDAGRGPARAWYDFHGIVAAAVWVVVLAVVAAAVWWCTTGRWRVVALGGLWASAAMLWWSQPPAVAMVEPDVGGRYVVTGTLALWIGLLFGARRRTAQAGAAALVALAVLQGALAGAEYERLAGAGPVQAFRADVAAFGTDPGTTLRVDPTTCRLAPDAVAQRAGFDVVADADTITVRPADVDMGSSVGVFVVLALADDHFVSIDDTGSPSPLDGFFFGGTLPGWTQPGPCFFGPPPPAVLTLVADGPVDLDRDRWDGVVFIGVGRSFGDALAKQTFVRLHPTS